jgi:hypothetical protein
MKPYIFLLLLFPSIAFSQTNVLRKVPKNHDQIPTWGANRTHFIQGVFGVGFYTPIGVANPDFKFGPSYDISFGAIYRYKIANSFNIGTSLSIAGQAIALNDVGMVKSWDNTIHSKASLSNSLFILKPFLRFNLSPKRGDYLGTFVDIGGFGSWNFYPVAMFTDKRNGERYVQMYQQDKQQERFQYGFFASVGRDWFRLEASYHLTNMLKDESFEMPRYAMAVVFGF